MSNKFTDAMSRMFDVSATVDLLQYDFVQQALIAGAILGLLAGIIGPLIVSRQMSFSVHGTSELSLTGASAALLVGVGVGFGAIVGSVVAAVLFGLLGAKARDRDSVIGVIMAFGLGLSVLFLWAYDGRTGTSFSLLVGQIVAPGNSGLELLLLCAVIVIGTLGFHLPPFAVRKHRPRSCCSSRCSGSGTVDRVRSVGRHHRSTRRTDRRCSAGDVAADHPRSGRRVRHGKPTQGHDPLRRVRRTGSRRRHPSLAGTRRSRLEFRHLGLVRDLPDMPTLRIRTPQECGTDSGARLNTESPYLPRIEVWATALI